MIAAMAREDSVDPSMASSVDKRLWEKAATEDNVTEERWKLAEAKKDADVMVECKAANCAPQPISHKTQAGRI